MKHSIANFFKSLKRCIAIFFKSLTRPIRRIQAELIYRSAVAQAKKLYSDTGERQFVIKSTKKNKPALLVMNRDNFRNLKKKHIIRPDRRIIDVQLSCFFATPDRSGREPMLPHQVAERKKKAIKYLLN